MNNKIQIEYEQLCLKIDQNNYISFDIFDTALLRNVLYPVDIFTIIEQKLKEDQNPIPNFKKHRIEAESQARKCSKREDIHFDEIYQVLAERVGDKQSHAAKQLEISIEREFTTGNRFIKRIYDYALAQGKKIWFISDMYLPKEFIGSLLKENGYDHFDALWVSGADGYTKSSRSMYRHIKEQYQLESGWLHIGDNRVSDYENARKENIEAYYYENIRIRAGIKGTYTLRQSIMKAIQINYTETEETLNYWQRFGFNTVSSLFYGFITWLMKELKGKPNVYFLARDGYLPYKLYEKLAAHREDLPTAQYLYASRRAYQVPNALNMKQEEALELLTAHNTRLGQSITVGEIFDNLRLNKQHYADIIGSFGFKNFTDELKNEHDTRNARELLKSIYPDIVNQLSAEMDLLKMYLKQHGINGNHEIHVVDVGWRGSTHKAIRDITGLSVHGYYLGTIENVYDDITDKVRGYAFNLGRPRRYRKSIMDNVMMYEFIFSAPHGSLLGFELVGDRVIPVLKKVEDNSVVIQALQDMSLAILSISDEYEKYAEYLQGLNSEECLSDYMVFINNKRYEDLVEFSKLTGIVGIGDSHSKQVYVSSVPSGASNAEKIKEIRRARTNLWPSAIMCDGNTVRRKEYALYKTINKIYSIFHNWYRLFVKALYNPRKVIPYIVDKLRRYL
jgi:HAD superfamily hydrolase (TIGR01549 family)